MSCPPWFLSPLSPLHIHTHHPAAIQAKHPRNRVSWQREELTPPGFVLTFSNQTGVDYLGQPFRDWLEQPDQFMADSDVSVLAHTAENFVASGTSRWHYPTVEWLVVYILTEAAVVPHNIRQGRNSTSLLTAYQDLARELVSSFRLFPSSLPPFPLSLPSVTPFPPPTTTPQPDQHHTPHQTTKP